MRAALFFGSLLGQVLSVSLASANVQEKTDRLYLISQKNLKLSSARVAPLVVDQSREHALVRLNAEQVQKLSTLLHDKQHVCGGYIDVTQEFAESKKDLKTFLRDQEETPMAEFDKVQPTFPEQVNLGLKHFDKDRYWKFLQELSSFPDRSASTQDGVRAAKWLGENALAYAAEHKRGDVTVRYFETGGYIQPSTLIKIPGVKPELPGVLIGGHMDTFSNQKPGADDDASGSATVMEVYRTIIKSGLKFDRDLYFAFYAAEERGLVGSGVMARQFVAEKIKLRGVVQFDMTGYKSPMDRFKIYFINDNVAPSMTNFLKKLVVTYLGLTPAEIGDDKCGYACSDHAQWQRNGYAAGFPFESSFEGYNNTIHTGEDKQHILDAEHSSQFAKLGIAFVIEAGDPASKL